MVIDIHYTPVLDKSQMDKYASTRIVFHFCWRFSVRYNIVADIYIQICGQKLYVFRKRIIRYGMENYQLQHCYNCLKGTHKSETYAITNVIFKINC